MTHKIPPDTESQARSLFGDLIEGRWEKARRPHRRAHGTYRLAPVGWWCLRRLVSPTRFAWSWSRMPPRRSCPRSTAATSGTPVRLIRRCLAPPTPGSVVVEGHVQGRVSTTWPARLVDDREVIRIRKTLGTARRVRVSMTSSDFLPARRRRTQVRLVVSVGAAQGGDHPDRRPGHRRHWGEHGYWCGHGAAAGHQGGPGRSRRPTPERAGAPGR